MDHGLRTHVAPVTIDYDLAVEQHANYCQMLRDCGAEVRTLDVNRALPDSTFIEDTAIVLHEAAVLASMGAESRRGEVSAVEAELRKYREVYLLEGPAAIEGGDVLRVGRFLLVGVSSRTDAEGLRAFETIVRRYGYHVLAVPVRRCLHLKTACTALPDASLLLNPDWLDVRSLPGFEKVPVPVDEPWGANTLTVGSTVCTAAEHAQTAELIRQRGLDVRTVDLSEFMKAEGGVTCLSLLLS